MAEQKAIPTCGAHEPVPSPLATLSKLLMFLNSTVFVTEAEEGPKGTLRAFTESGCEIEAAWSQTSAWAGCPQSLHRGGTGRAAAKVQVWGWRDCSG